MRAGGPLRIAAWSTWSGRERSSHNHFPQVPQIRLANLASLSYSVLPSPQFFIFSSLLQRQAFDFLIFSIDCDDKV